MLVSDLLISAFRNLWQHRRLRSLISMVSLMLGLTVFSFAFLYVRQESSYDKGWPYADRIHRVIASQQGVPGRNDSESDNLPAMLFPSLQESFSAEIDKATRTYTTSVGISLSSTETTPARLTVADPQFADIFRLEVLSGSIEQALQNPGFIAVEESIANAFPDTMKLGDTLILNGTGRATPGTPSAKIGYEIAAIYRLPKDISDPVKFRMLTLMDDYSLQLFPDRNPSVAWNGSVRIWLTLKPRVNVDRVNSEMIDFVDRSAADINNGLNVEGRLSNYLSYRLQPVTDLHFSPLANEAFGQHGDKNQMLTIFAIGTLVLLVGCSNSISLSLATVLERRRHTGIHKVVGALQSNIALQFLTESGLLVLLAFMLAMGLVEQLLPPIRALLRYQSDLTINLVDFAFLGSIAVFVGIVSSAYPALVLAGIKPQQVLKSNSGAAPRSNNQFRTWLVGFQFCLTAILMIVTLALLFQLQVLRNQPLGFNARNLVYLQPQIRDVGPVQHALLQIFGVSAVSLHGNPPNANMPANINTQMYINRNGGEDIEVHMPIVRVGAKSLDMLEIPLLAGRIFEEGRDDESAITNSGQGPDNNREEAIVLNRAAVKNLGFSSPMEAIGKLIVAQFSNRDGTTREVPKRIIGVIEDSMLASLRRKPGPEVYSFLSSSSRGFNILLKFDEKTSGSIQESITRAINNLSPAAPPNFMFVESHLAAEFAVEKNQGASLIYCAGLALFLSIIGLFGLSSSTMQHSVKDIAVRRAMGASTGSLTILYLWRYARPVLTATILASPVGAYFVLQWLQRFPYQLERWWLLPICVAAGIMVLVISLLTVGSIVLKAAKRSPVVSLRYE